MHLLRWLAVSLAAVLAGCANVSQGVPSSAAVTQADKAGWVFGSVGISGRTPYTSQGFLYRAVGAGDSAIVRFRYDSRPAMASPLGIGKLMNETPDFTSRVGETGVVFAYRLRPGEYELFDVEFHINSGQLQQTFHARQKFSVKFRVEEGTATYLGEFLARGTTGKNVLGMTVPGGGFFAMRNRMDRDLGILHSKGIQMPRDKVINASAVALEARLPFFQENGIPDNH